MESVYSRFRLQGGVISCARYGSGHINETYLVVTDAPHLYIMQKINSFVFKDAEGLMRNITAVTEHIRKKGCDYRHVLTLVPAADGESYIKTEAGEYFRMYEYVTDSLCLDAPRNVQEFRYSGIAFGGFQSQLKDFPASTLCEIIPHFHDTPARLEQLKQAVLDDKAGRLGKLSGEVEFFLSRERDAAELMKLLNAGELPLRVTHNDTKLNNVMLDRQTGMPLCVIDLDTVMPGLPANDFGDSIRFGASTAKEDETDLSKVTMSLELFEAYADGFISACGGSLTKLEKEVLPIGAKLMTLECGARFLADYLNGDTYFHIARENHNLDRAHTQMKLVEDMERKWGEMNRIISGM